MAKEFATLEEYEASLNETKPAKKQQVVSSVPKKEYASLEEYNRDNGIEQQEEQQSVPIKSSVRNKIAEMPDYLKGNQSPLSDRELAESMRVKPANDSNIPIPTESGIVNPSILNTNPNVDPNLLKNLTPKDYVAMQKGIQEETDRGKGFIPNLVTGMAQSNTGNILKAYSGNPEYEQYIDKVKSLNKPDGVVEETGALLGQVGGDLPLMALGALIGGPVGAVGLPRMLNTLAEFKLKQNDRQINAGDVTKDFAMDMGKDYLKSVALGKALEIAGAIPNRLAMGKAVDGVRKSALASNTAMGQLSESAFEIPVLMGLGNVLDDAPINQDEFMKNVMLDAVFKTSTHLGNRSNNKTTESQPDIIDDVYKKYVADNPNELVRVRMREMLRDGQSSGDVLYNIMRAESENPKFKVSDKTKGELFNILKEEETFLNKEKDFNTSNNAVPIKSDLTKVRERFDKDNSFVQRKLESDQSITNFFQAQDIKNKQSVNRQKAIDKFLSNKESDMSVLMEYNKTLADFKDSMDNVDVAKSLYRDMDTELLDDVVKIHSVSPKMEAEFNKDMAISANNMSRSKKAQILNNQNWGRGTTPRIIYRHLGPKIYEYIYRPLNAVVAQAESGNRKIEDISQGWKAKLTPQEQMEVSRHIFEQQVTRDGKSAVDQKEMTFNGVPKREYEDMTPQQQEAIKWLGDYTHEMFMDINKARKLTGKSELTELPNYGPLMAKDFASRRGNFMMEKDMVDYLKNNPKEVGNLKERVGSDADIIENIFDAIPKYDRYVRRAIYVTPVTYKVRNLADKLSLFNNKAGDYIRNMTLDTEGSAIDGGQLAGGIRKVSELMSVGKLAGNFGTAVLQSLAVIPATVTIGVKPMLKASFDLLMNPSKMQDNLRKSPELQSATADMSMLLAQEAFSSKAMKEVVKYGFMPMKLIDRAVRQVTWQAAYDQALKNGESPAQARSTAGRLATFTQGSSERQNRAPLFRGSTGKLFAALQSFKLNEFHYMISDVMGVDRPQTFMKYYSKDELSEAKEYANKNGWELQEMDNKGYAVYKKESLINYVKHAEDFAKLLVAMTMANMAIGLMSAETGIPMMSPYADPLGAWFESKYGVSFNQYLAGHAKKESTLSERDQKLRAGMSAVQELTKVIPFIQSPDGAIIGTAVRGGDKLGRGLANQNYWMVAEGANDLSSLVGNPASAITGLAMRGRRQGLEQAKQYIANDRKGTLTDKEKDYNDSWKQKYFIDSVKNKRLEDKEYRAEVKNEKGGGSDSKFQMKKFGGMKKFGEFNK